MGPIADQILDGGIVAIVTAASVWIGLAKHMEKKYQTLIDAKIAEAAQKIVNELLEQKLAKLKRKALFNNLVAMRLMKEHPNIPFEEIEALRKSCELNASHE